MTLTLEHHLATPNVSLQEHVSRIHADLASQLSNKRSIYLDTKYWIVLRDVIAGVRTSPAEIELLAMLRSQAAQGDSFCPISESTFMELYKQRDPRTRYATALLIDELSLGVSLIPFDSRVLMEIENLISHPDAGIGTKKPQHLPWSKLSYTLGMVHPVNTGFDAATELAIQKSFFDKMWSMSLADIVNTIGDNLPPSAAVFDTLAEKLNIGNANHADELRSYSQAYGIEASGAADVFAEKAALIVSQLNINTTSQRVPMEGEAWNKLIRQCHGMIVGALKKEQGKATLRTLHINTCLHANRRWNKGHQYEANDFNDFHHAAAALGYCDVFLTERRLKSIITAKQLELDVLYSCKVAANVEDALVTLHQARAA